MSIDRLQEKIRKRKNPSAVFFEALPDLVPASYLGDGQWMEGCKNYYLDLLKGLKEAVPCVRFGLGSFAIAGPKGIQALQTLLEAATGFGYYVILDLPELLTVAAIERAAYSLCNDGVYSFDGVIVNGYFGSDILKPLSALCKQDKSVFVLNRTANRSASELYDLMTGGRLVHTACADVITRHGESYLGKCGYSGIAALAAASSADSLRTLRSKYSKLFLLLDGFDYPNSNAKNCSYAFDRFGHGAAACSQEGIVGAWKEDGAGDPIAAAVAAAERMKKNLTRYVSVL